MSPKLVFPTKSNARINRGSNLGDGTKIHLKETFELYPDFICVFSTPPVFGHVMSMTCNLSHDAHRVENLIVLRNERPTHQQDCCKEGCIPDQVVFSNLCKQIQTNKVI